MQQLEIAVFARNGGERPWQGTISLRVIDEATGTRRSSSKRTQYAFDASTRRRDGQAHPPLLPKAKLWHFDRPQSLSPRSFDNGARAGVLIASTFGVRKFEVRGRRILFKRRAGTSDGRGADGGQQSVVRHGGAGEWIAHDHDDLKHLNCVFTRVHWQQDRRVLDYCDRHGILIQSEVPTWGPNTFKGMGEEPDADILENGREQLREMIARDRNHPSICSWGLCNEIGGQNPPAYNFAKHMLEEAEAPGSRIGFVLTHPTRCARRRGKMCRA